MRTAGRSHMVAAFEGASGAIESMEERLERILRLQREATYPLSPVAGVWAQAQLAQVEVPWLMRGLQEAMAWIKHLEKGPVESCGRCQADAACVEEKGGAKSSSYDSPSHSTEPSVDEQRAKAA
jgi:hypothetical protein